jgi:glutathione S-transferase
VAKAHTLDSLHGSACSIQRYVKLVPLVLFDSSSELSILIMASQKNITSAIDRYTNEIKRVSGVIDAHLKKQGTAYLLGDHAIYADLAWIPWFRMATMFLIKDWEYKTELPVFSKWFDALNSRPAVVKTVEKPEFQRK